jgi:hypothetical protein
VSGQGSLIPNSGDFLEDHAITVLANPSSGWAFDHWEGSLNGKQSLTTLIMDSDKTITAYFVETGEIVILPIPTTAPASATPTNTASIPSGFTTYTDEYVGFSMFVPSSWEEAPMEEPGVIFVSTSSCSGNYPSASVLKMASSGLSLQVVYTASKYGVESLEGYTCLYDGEITIGDTPAMKITYIWVLEGVTIKTTQCILVTEQTGWVLTFTSIPACWSTYESTFNTIMNSFRVLD